MTKFAVVVLAALAFQAASARLLLEEGYQGKALGDYGYRLQDPTWDLRYHSYPTGKFDALFGQLQTVAKDLTVFLQRAVPNDRLLIRTLAWQSRELACYIDAIIERLQVETYNCDGQVGMILREIVGELREIQMQYYQLADFTTDGQMTKQFYMTMQRTIVQLEKLVRLVENGFDRTQGELYMIVQTLITDFLYAFRNFSSRIQYYGTYGQKSPNQIIVQIQEVTDGLIRYLQGVTQFDGQRKYAIYEYGQHVGAIIRRMQEVEGTYGNCEIFQDVYNKLRRVLVPFMQMMNTKNMLNVEVVRMDLTRELQFVAEALERCTSYQCGGEYQTFFFEMLGDYLYAIQHFRMQMENGYLSYYGLYNSGFYGYNEFPGFLGKYGYQGLYKYGELYGQTGFFGNCQGCTKYGQGTKYFEMQIQTLMRDLYQLLRATTIDNVTARQAFMRMIYEYYNRLDFIVERLYQCTQYSADSDSYMFREIVQNLRQYVLGLKQFCSLECSSMQISTQFYTYVQKIAIEFERLIAGLQYSQGTFYNCMQELLSQYMTATRYLCRMMENNYEYRQSGYFGPYSQQYYDNNYFGGKYFGGIYGQQFRLGKYGQGYGYGYGLGQYGKGYGLGQFGNGYDLKQYGKRYSLDKYGRGYSVDQSGKGYGIGQYGRGYGFDQYGKGHGSGQYGRGYELGQSGKGYGLGPYGRGYGLSQYERGYGYGYQYLPYR